MVMAGTERAPAPSTDDSLASRLQWLQQRREALQEKLALKNSELKNLCLDEAELTGILPPEIPLEPGESPPTFRRRVGTCLAYPQNLINRLKTNEAEESTLELERQLQVGIANTALGKLNDPAESKAVRRKQRSIYQQSQRRLRELDARLNFIRQAYGRVHLRPHVSTLEPSSHSTGDLTQSQTNAKHRTKKPRPPLDNLECESGSKTLPSRTILQETGINLSPSGAESQHQNHAYRQAMWSAREYRMPLEEPGTSTLSTDSRNYNHRVSPTVDGTVDRRRNLKYPEHDFNDNHDLYILPDRYRPRTYSQGTQGSNGGINVCGQKYCQDTERNYRTIPNTYTEEERQIRYRQMQQKRHLDSYTSQQQQQQPQQILPQHQKPPPHQNYRNYNTEQQHNQQILDNRSPQLPYSQSDEFPNRSNVRYRNFAEEPRETKKNHGQQPIQRGRNTREPVSVSRVSKTNLQECSPPETLGQLTTTGYWIRENDETVWSEDSPTERFGSLDRRKYNAQCAAYNAGFEQQIPNHEERGGQQRQSSQQQQQQQQQHSGSSIASSSSSSRDYVLGLTGATKYPSSSAVTSHHHQNYNSQVLLGTNSPSYEAVSTAPRILVRTQSLGSVETWQQNPGNSIATRDIHEMQQSPNMRRDDGAGRRGKEKEWYETWMDSGFPGPLSPGFEISEQQQQIREISMSRQIPPGSPQHLPIPGARSAAMQLSFAPPPPPPPPPPPSPPLPSYNSKGLLPRAASAEQQRIATLPHPQQQQQQQRYNQNHRAPQRHPPSPKSREIPAESKPSNDRRQRGDENMTTGSDRSPDLCTIVHAGKYQPYREVTKPFEMSDFYKYSTKYRKRAEAITLMRNSQITNNTEDDDVCNRKRHDSAGSANIRDDQANHLIVNPVQRKIYEPVQRMTCQPYGNSAKNLGDDGAPDWRTSNNSRNSSEDSTVV